MLILSRRINETIHIGDNVTVTVLGVVGSHVKIGIHAPEKIAVHRSEVYDRIQRHKKAQEKAQAMDTFSCISATI